MARQQCDLPVGLSYRTREKAQGETVRVRVQCDGHTVSGPGADCRQRRYYSAALLSGPRLRLRVATPPPPPPLLHRRGEENSSGLQVSSPAMDGIMKVLDHTVREM